MNRWRTVGLAVGCVVALTACDFRGRGYEDLRLMRLNEGNSTEQDVRNLFGAPAAIRDVPGGKGLVYPLGPEGPYTLLIKIDANGKYQGRENLLTRANFERVRPGTKELDVLVALGRPGRAERYPLKQQSAWEWRFLDGPTERLFVVTFDAGGNVVSSAIEEDPRRFGGR
ncbi:MAG: hypothetical protein ABJA83_10930 [Burkholderiaceae bacterium]